MKFSTELEILIESIKVSLLEQSPDRFNYLLQQKSLNWQRLKKMAAYHAVRPILYDAFQKVGFQNEYVEKLRAFCLEQTVMNLTTEKELSYILELLKANNLRVSPYKGIFFLKNLYGGKQLREIGDLDILIHPSDAKEALKILNDGGYHWAEDVRVEGFTDEEIDWILESPPKEVGLDKGIIHIDFHWGIAEQYRDLRFDYRQLFTEKEFSVEKILYMILIHHGSRDCWLRLKYVADFMMFMKKFEKQLDCDVIHQNLKSYKIFRSSKIGLLLVKQFSQKKHEENNHSMKLIINYWERAEVWKNLKNKILYNQIYFSMQDDSFSVLSYIKNYFKANSYPNPIENKRIITFPRNYPFLNLLSKILSMFVRNLFGK